MKLADITPDYVIDNWILGVPLRDILQQNRWMPDSESIKYDITDAIKERGENFIQTHIDTHIADTESKLGVFLSPRRVATPPLDGEDPDIAGVPMTYRKADWLRFNEMALPYNNILSIERIRMFHGDHYIGEIPKEWIVIKNARVGLISIVPYGGGTFFTGVTSLGLGIMTYLAFDHLPGFWRIDLACGLDELPADIVRMIAMGAARDVLGILSNAFSGGISSRSISFDGFSASVGTTASAIYSLYSALESSYKEILKKEVNHLKQYHRGIKVFRV